MQFQVSIGLGADILLGLPSRSRPDQKYVEAG